MHTNVEPYYKPLTPVWGQKVKRFFFWRRLRCISHYVIKMYDFMHTPFGLGKMLDMEIVQICIIWLNLVT